MSLSVDSAYAAYFWNSMDTVHIDRDGLYRAMLRDGKTSLTATATLTYTVEYYTSDAEEQAFEEKLDEVIADLNPIRLPI